MFPCPGRHCSGPSLCKSGWRGWESEQPPGGKGSQASAHRHHPTVAGHLGPNPKPGHPETRSSRNPVIQKQRQDPMRRETIAERTAGPCATATRAAAETGRPMKALTSLLRAAYPPPDKNRGNTLYAVSAASLMAVCLTVAEATQGIGAPSKAARPSPGAARGRMTVPFCAALPHAT